MIRIVLSFFILFISTLTFGQSQSGKITYKLKPPEEVKQFIDTTGQDDQFKSWILKQYDEIKKTAPYVEFSLTFTPEEALFEHPKSMASDGGMDLRLILEGSGAYGPFYMNTTNKSVLHQVKSNNKDWLIQTGLNDFDWEITRETKEIQGFSCKKATSQFPHKQFLKNTDVIAWFCPDIPLQYGPRGITGLPGVILEMTYNHYTFYADKVSLTKKDYKIKKPTKGTIISQDDYSEQVKKSAPPRH